MKTFGAIDIGTNSVLLLIGKIKENKSIEPIHEDLKVTRIGKGVYDTKLITDEGIKKTLAVLKNYVEKCKESGVERIRTIGTSALRIAENSNIFLDIAKKETGISVEIISGTKEAELSFLGAISGIEDENIDAVIIDIGGGSTEIIYGINKKIQYSKSLEIGSVRLTEKFLKSDPVKENEIEKVRNYIKTNLKTLSPSPFSPPVSPLPLGERDRVRENSQSNNSVLIGVAGTVTTLAQIDMKIPCYDRLKIGNWKLEINNLKEITSLLKEKTIEERKRVKGLEPERADVILAGAIILEEIMDHLGFNKVYVSTRGLRYGAMMEMIEKIKD